MTHQFSTQHKWPDRSQGLRTRRFFFENELRIQVSGPSDHRSRYQIPRIPPRSQMSNIPHPQGQGLSGAEAGPLGKPQLSLHHDLFINKAEPPGKLQFRKIAEEAFNPLAPINDDSEDDLGISAHRIETPQHTPWVELTLESPITITAEFLPQNHVFRHLYLEPFGVASHSGFLRGHLDQSLRYDPGRPSTKPLSRICVSVIHSPEGLVVRC